MTVCNLMAIIYLLKKNGEVVYVGKADNIDCADNRVKSHRRDKKFDQVEYLETENELLAERENKLILDYLPKYNKAAKKDEFYSNTTEMRDFAYRSFLKFLEDKNVIKNVGKSKYVKVEELGKLDLSKVFDGLSYYDHISELRAKEIENKKRKYKEEQEKLENQRLEMEEEHRKEKIAFQEWGNCIKNVEERVAKNQGTEKQIKLMEGLLVCLNNGFMTPKQIGVFKSFGGVI